MDCKEEFDGEVLGWAGGDKRGRGQEEAGRRAGGRGEEAGIWLKCLDF